MASDDLQDFVSGKYIKFDTNDPVIKGVYKGHAVEDDPFNKDEKRVVYTLEIDGEEKLLPSKSKRLASRIMEKSLKVGEEITIKRHGAGFDIDYEVEVGGKK
jgi:hypothetical protein